MLPLAYFGIESSGLNLVIDLLIVFVVVLWISLVYWTYMDARRRIEDPMLIGCAVAASLFPFAGTIVYVILRPPEYLEDVRERELEMQTARARLYELDNGVCPHCNYRVERDFIRCPSCLRKLKERCVSCGRPIERTWAICPYCETEVPDAVSTRRRRRRRGQPLDDDAELQTTSALGGSAVDGPAVALEEPAVGSPLEPPARGSAREGPAAGSALEPPARGSAREAQSAPTVSPAGDAAGEAERARPVPAHDQPPPRPRGGRARYPRSGS
jgi:hypothetical protein